MSKLLSDIKLDENDMFNNMKINIENISVNEKLDQQIPYHNNDNDNDDDNNDDENINNNFYNHETKTWMQTDLSNKKRLHKSLDQENFSNNNNNISTKETSVTSWLINTTQDISQSLLNSKSISQTNLADTINTDTINTDTIDNDTTDNDTTDNNNNNDSEDITSYEKEEEEDENTVFESEELEPKILYQNSLDELLLDNLSEIDLIEKIKQIMPEEVLNNLDIIVRELENQYNEQLNLLIQYSLEKNLSVQDVLKTIHDYPTNKQIDSLNHLYQDYHFIDQQQEEEQEKQEEQEEQQQLNNDSANKDSFSQLISSPSTLDQLIKGITLSTNNKQKEFLYLNIVIFLYQNNLLSFLEYNQWMHTFLTVHHFVTQGHDFQDSQIYYQNLLNLVIENKDFLQDYSSNEISFNTNYLSQSKTIHQPIEQEEEEQQEEEQLSVVDITNDLLFSELFNYDLTRLYYIMNQLKNSNSQITLKKNIPIFLPNSQSGHSLMKKITIELKELNVNQGFATYNIVQNKEKGILIKNSLYKIIYDDIKRNTENNLFVIEIINNTGHEIDYQSLLFSKLPFYFFLKVHQTSFSSTKIYCFKKINHFSDHSQSFFIDIVTSPNSSLFRDFLSKKTIVDMIFNNLSSKRDTQYIIYNTHSNDINSFILSILEQLFEKLVTLNPHPKQQTTTTTTSTTITNNSSIITNENIDIKDIRVFSKNSLSFAMIKF